MFLTSQQAADKFGITVEKLERISNRKDCPANFVDTKGYYDEEKVGKILAHMRKQADKVKEYYTKKKCEAAPESFDEFVMRFWETDEMWRDFVTVEVDEKWFRYFISAALEFGYKTAHPEQ